MNRAGQVIFILGIFIALVAGVGVFALIALSQPQPTQVPTVKVVVAFQQINMRSEINDNQVGLADWPRAMPTPPGAFSATTDVVGKLALVPIYQGEVILQKEIVDKANLKETHSNAALLLDKGTVAVAMPVTVKADVANAIQAGDRVDLIATFQSLVSTGPGTIATQRVLADMLVIQVGTWPGGVADQKGQAQTQAAYLTLQLKEQEAMVLEYTLLHANSVTLVLRPANDRDILTLEPITFEYINQRYGFKLPR